MDGWKKGGKDYFRLYATDSTGYVVSIISRTLKYPIH